MSSNLHVRICPICNVEIQHKNKYSCKKGIELNKPCGVCSRRLVGLNNKGRQKTKETRQKISKKIKNHPSIKGNKERGQKIHEKLINRDVSSWHKGKTSIIQCCIGCGTEIETQQHRIDTHKFCGRECQTQYYWYKGIWQPRFNPNACKIIEQYGLENGYNFQHALNGGEFYIKDLGYFVDGYDKEKNVVIEYYEKHHNNQIEKDMYRIQQIKQKLNCKIIIINYQNNIEIYE
jgi:hypothetical protein